jgi:NAD(P)-dependent dehydrogenase (short-subunit alcohol dehydrogenase family)
LTKHLSNKVIIIAGAGPGVGHASAVMCAQEGADVVLAGRTLETLESVAADVREVGGRALTVVADITSAPDCARLADEAIKEFGHVDGLVVVAYRSADKKTMLESEDDFSNWQPIVEANVFGTLKIVKAVASRMVTQGTGGSIVIINSMASNQPWPMFGAYAGSKAALAGFTRNMAWELGTHKIRINGMHAGGIWNEPLKKHIQLVAERNGTTPEEELRKEEALCALGYVPPAEDYAGSVMYLLSDLSKPVTGQALHANAGRFMY